MWLGRRLQRRAGRSVSPGFPAGLVDCGGGTGMCRLDADQAVTVLYAMHYRALTRLAALLVSDVALAEEVVQDAFVAMHSAWRHIQDSDDALSYLKRTVVSRSRARRAAHANPPGRQPGSGGQAIARPESQPLVALRALPPRQREALILRYYAGFAETQIAAVMGISARAVHNHLAGGMSALLAVQKRSSLAPRPAVDTGG